jgi:glycosyltransferase involved in cell wall biosynthesis
MRIAFDHQVFGAHEYSGISRYFHEIASEIALDPNHAVAIIAPLYVNKYLRSRPKSLQVFGLPIPKLPRTGRMISASNRLLSGPFSNFFRPDIYHETNYSVTSQVPSGARVVTTVYDMIQERLPGMFENSDHARTAKKAAIARADHIICISESTRRDLLELLDVPNEKTSVVHLGVGLRLVKAANPQFLPPEKAFFLYVGTRFRYKNFDGFVRAFGASAVLQRDFDIVCFGGGRLTSDEHELLRSCGVKQSTVHQIDGDDSVLARLYASAHSFIYPSHYEGFGIPVLEAMAHDCPVACSNTSSLPEIAGEAALPFDPSDVDSMRSAMETIASSETLRATLVQKGRIRLGSFSWNRCARETIALYSKLLQRMSN